MDENTPPNSGPLETWRVKWRFVAVYWLIQAIAFHLFTVFVFDAESTPSLSRALGHLLSADALVLNGIAIIVLTASQGVLLIPVRRPRMALDPPGVRFLHCAIGGLAIAGVSWLALWPIMIVLEIAGAGVAFDNVMRTHLGWIEPLAVWVIATLLLWIPVRDGLPVKLSVTLSALAAAMLFAGLVGAVCSLVRLALDKDFDDLTIACMSGAVLLGWGVATPLAWSFVRRRGTDDALSRLSSRLFLGTMIETAAIIPIDVMIRRKASCYCGQGTYWALAACWAVGLFALGPVIFLVPLSRRRKRWYAGRCDACGYDMSGCMTAERCPECGAGWKPAEPTSGC